MRIAILTSSRADYGIYLPLIKKLKEDPFFNVDIIAFGTHLSPFYGETIKQIQNDGFEVKYKVESMLLTDSAEAIATAVGLTTIKFADFWQKNKSEFDIVFCLGDRYEMFAAVTAGIPFNIPFGHLHGGETTLGAIDNIYRHAITLASKYHFVSTKSHADKVVDIIGTKEGIFNVGALSLANLTTINFLSLKDFNEKWNIDLSLPTILTTFHPETVALSKNEFFANQLIEVINELSSFQFLITMPNADTSGNIIRKYLIDNFSNSKRIFLIENLGSQSYFTAMNYCSFLLGNTSSGIIEAASFNKYVINIGDRQKGRSSGANVIHVPIETKQILNEINKLGYNTKFMGENIYYQSNSAQAIINALKNI